MRFGHASPEVEATAADETKDSKGESEGHGYLQHNLSIIVPAYDSAGALATLLPRIRDCLGGLGYRVYVVDDGSTDDTSAVTGEFTSEMPVTLIRHATRRGYGAALRTGFLAAIERRGYLITLPADSSVDPSSILELVKAAEYEVDLAVATRRRSCAAELGRGLHRIAWHALNQAFEGRFELLGIRYQACRLRLYRAALIDRLVREFGRDGFVSGSDRFPDSRLLARSRRVGARIAEVRLERSVDEGTDGADTSHPISFRDLLPRFRSLSGPVRTETPEGTEATESGSVPLTGSLEALVTLLSDLLAIVLAFGLGVLLYRGLVASDFLNRAEPSAQVFSSLTSTFLLAMVVVFTIWGLYKPSDGILHVWHLRRVTHAYFVSAAIFLTIWFFAASFRPPRLMVFSGILWALPLLLLGRRITAELFTNARRKAGLGRRILIYGAGDTGSLLMKKIVLSPKLGSTVVGFLDDLLPVGTRLTCELSQSGRRVYSSRVLGKGSDLEEVVLRHRVEELLIALPTAEDSLIARQLVGARDLGIEAGFVPHLGGVKAELLELDQFSALPVLRIVEPNRRPVYEASKRFLDLIGASLLLSLSLPVWIAAYVLLRRETGGSLIFRQKRIGLNGVPFTIFKFRTMRSDASPYENSPAARTDPRVTPIGRIFRAASLDEIPQLLNVFLGEMSLVGPRPEMPFVVAGYGRNERQRLKVKPGLTGLWQISPDRGQEIHSNLEYDLVYLTSRGFVLDCLILLETAWLVVGQIFGGLRVRVGGASARALRTGLRKLRSIGFGPARESLTSRGPARPTLLVALDQRRRSGEPDSWRKAAEAVISLAHRVDVRVAIAPRNAERFQQLLEGHVLQSAAPGERNGHAEFIPYTRPSSVQTAAGHASVVVTDLDLFADLAGRRGARVVRIDSSAEIGSDTCSRIVGEIDRTLSTA